MIDSIFSFSIVLDYILILKIIIQIKNISYCYYLVKFIVLSHLVYQISIHPLELFPFYSLILHFHIFAHSKIQQ